VDSPSFFGVGVFVRDQLIAVGYCRALGPDDRPFQRALLYAGYVDPRWRLRHVGRVLHHERLAQLQCAGGEEAFAWVEPRNIASIASLRACGFRQVARQTLWGQASTEQVLLRCALGRRS
jgi:ribosomal protein S18 acetylase RimI-like enzyme